MTYSGLLEWLGAEPSLAGAVRLATEGQQQLSLSMPKSAQSVVAGALHQLSGRPVLVVTSTFREAERATATLSTLLGDDQVCYYPAWEILPHERLSPRSDTVSRRMKVLRRLAGNDDEPAPSAVVAPVRALLQPQVKGLSELLPVRISKGAEYEIGELAKDLVNAAYSRVDLVERRGDFAVRGGIVDVFPPGENHPVRIDFFGDEIEDIRYFTVADQRSGEIELDHVVCDPCRELLLNESVRTKAAALVDAHPELADLLEHIAQGQAVEGMEALTPALVDELELLLDVMPADTLVLLTDPELVATRAVDLVRTSHEFLSAGWAAAASAGQAPIDLESSGYWELADIREHALSRGFGWWGLSQFAIAPDDIDADGQPDFPPDIPGHLSLHLQPAPLWHGDAESAVSYVAEEVRSGTRVIIAAEGRGMADRFAELLHGAELSVQILDSLSTSFGADGVAGFVDAATGAQHDVVTRDVSGVRDLSGSESWIAASPAAPRNDVKNPRNDVKKGGNKPSSQANTVTIVTSPLPGGFLAPEINLALHTSADISGQQAEDRATKKLPSKRRNQVVPLELKPGDPLVHEQHGVGRYVEMTQRTVAGAVREYMVIEYAPSKRGQPGDRLYVPMDQLDQVTRYVGGEAPQLDRMGGADWRSRKSRARRAVKEIAAELIKLYAARQATRGFKFSPDTPWQRELEDAFTYVETPDQLNAINDVKHDMEQVVPMDRLISGDVGYGKTEIAVRAAFKAVQDGKQVAVLVPTTLLVQQHSQTFQARYAGFPINVAPMSRFQTDNEVKKTIEGLASGRVDVAIGTHRLLSEKVQFKDLGLVIIDEEQRFGVEHKEALKKLRVNVDVLAMSATPIPRTLEMAVTGIREMSTIATPPEERHPVLTFVGAYDEGQITAAIRRELAREGQAFFVHNRVQNIEKIAARLRELVPEARVMTAHGQMGEKALEKVMVDFWEQRADVLVCTTIVEAGLDISTANTLIVDQADKMGLSQLHQLRGRVGRGRERGYAYFLYPADKALTQTAHDRLSALAANAELGSGMAIAMKDLEIRGAGNLLGDEQSGHIADVGFDLYLRLVGEAVADYRGEKAEEEIPMRIELPIDAHLASDYVESERLRLEMYKRIAEVASEEDIQQLKAELADRYGPVPESAEALFNVARFRLLCRSVGLREVVAQGNFIRFAPLGENGAKLPESRKVRLERLYPGTVVKFAAAQMLVPRPVTKTLPRTQLADATLLDWANELVTTIFGE